MSKSIRIFSFFLIFLLYFSAAIVNFTAEFRALRVKMKFLFGFAASAAVFCFSASAANYSGNGNSVFDGPIGLSSLILTDDRTSVSGTFDKAPNGFNDVLVLYIDSTVGGFASTVGFADGSAGLNKAVSGFDGGLVNRSILTFTPGFLPDYAIALGPVSDNFGGLFQLAIGGANSLNFITLV